jgi:hypothetical protein
MIVYQHLAAQAISTESCVVFSELGNTRSKALDAGTKKRWAQELSSLTICQIKRIICLRVPQCQNRQTILSCPSRC